VRASPRHAGLWFVGVTPESVIGTGREVAEMTGTYRVARDQHIDAPPSAVRERIVDLHRWRSWSPWEELDPDLRRTYGGPDHGVGAWYEWSGNRKAGKGRMEIIEADAATVRFDLQFRKPFRSHSNMTFELQPDGDGTTVTWTLVGRTTGTTRVMGWFTSMDAMVGPDFDEGLVRLKAATEAASG
jgi:hypothetical protein